MAHDETRVRKVLDQAKSAGRSALTAPEAKDIREASAGDVEVEEAAEYLYQHGIPAYAYSTEIPVAVLGAKYRWARGEGLIPPV